jgi:hypothetical protein
MINSKQIKISLIAVLTTSLGACNNMNQLYTSGLGYGIFTAMAFLVIVGFIFIRVRKR